jgi:catechol 2,3-dioxygenase-like lactoylglutathione lyase family enzyme
MKFAHVNLIARDWKKLAQFYIDVFGCEAVYPERNISGEWVDQLTGLTDAGIQGIHLKLPGYQDGPTLEIFQYQPPLLRDNDPEINHQGFGHIAYRVDNINELMSLIIEKGGNKYGELVQKQIPEVGKLTVIYMKDIEGNIIELQNWQ